MAKRYFINQFDHLEDLDQEQKMQRRTRGARGFRTRLRGKRMHSHANEGRRRHLARPR
jgi:hypothetical protein